MNIDFHVHGLLSKRKDFNCSFFLEEIKFAKANGLDGFILCEHFNARAFEDIHLFLKRNYPYDGDRYLIDGFSVFPGIEVTIKDKGHIIVAGNRDSILDIHEELKNHMLKENLIQFKSLLDLADQYNCLKIGAHPCRKGHKLTDKSLEDLKRLDCLDLNAKDIYKKGKIVTMSEIKELAHKIDKKIITGSDSHTPLQLGTIKTIIKKECSTIDKLREAIINGDFEIAINDSLEFKVYTSKVLKRYLINTREYDQDTMFRI